MSPVTRSRCVDLARALARLGGDEKILGDAAAGFGEVAPGSMALLRGAVARRDLAAVRFSAHRLRGQAATFEALDLIDAIAAVERIVADAPIEAGVPWSVADAAVESIEGALRDVLAALRRAASAPSR